MKFLKLFLIAVVLVGGVTGLMFIIPDSKPIDKPVVSSAAGESWLKKIDALCTDGAWSKTGYDSIETGIQLDKNQSVLTIDEARSLQDYLFASSCYYVKDGADKLFKQSSYPADKVSHYEAALNYLKTKGKRNSNLDEADNMYSSYRTIMGLLVPKGGATYSHPLRAYSGDNAGSAKSRIQGMPYFKSHFSNNNEIMAKLNKLSDNSGGADQYYSDLEHSIEQHYRGRNISGEALNSLLEDQMRFNEISTNSSAKSRLNDFINNNQ